MPNIPLKTPLTTASKDNRIDATAFAQALDILEDGDECSFPPSCPDIVL